jgi:hypothetical protein
MLSMQTSYADQEIQLISAAEFDFSVTPFELWNGTQLEPMQLPGLNSSSDTPETPQPTETNQTLTFKDSENNSVTRSLVNQSTSDLAFADPIDFELWRLVKWTLFVLVIAGGATYFLRLKQSPVLKLNNSRKIELIETLTIDPRTKVHLVSIGTEKYLIASDMNGVKSMTLVPNWHVDSEADSSKELDVQTKTETFLSKAS